MKKTHKNGGGGGGDQTRTHVLKTERGTHIQSSSSTTVGGHHALQRLELLKQGPKPRRPERDDTDTHPESFEEGTDTLGGSHVSTHWPHARDAIVASLDAGVDHVDRTRQDGGQGARGKTRKACLDGSQTRGR